MLLYFIVCPAVVPIENLSKRTYDRKITRERRNNIFVIICFSVQSYPIDHRCSQNPDTPDPMVGNNNNCALLHNTYNVNN